MACRQPARDSIPTVMARTTKKRKTPRRNKAPGAPQWGFDYGCPPNAMAVGGLDFTTLLTDAHIDGIAYGTGHSPELNEEVPAITLVAQDGDALAKAFSIFHNWTTSSDPDAVEMTFVFRDSRSYILGISPEPSRMEQRLLGYARTRQAISVSALWCKPIDSVHPMLLSFRDHYASARIAPYILDGATYFGPRTAIPHAASIQLREVSGLRPLLKFEVTFVNESEVAAGTIGWLASRIQSSPRPQASAGPNRPESNEISARRHRALSEHFPVTLERMRSSAEVQEMSRQLLGDGIEPWQVEQALCNLVLSMDLDKEHVKTRQQMRERIIATLDARFECADGSVLPLFGIDRIRSQVLADGNELLTHLKKKRKDDLSAMQSRLRSLRVSDGASVVMGKSPRKRR